MNNLKEITIGSNAFFSSFSDFNPKDEDILVIVDESLDGKNCFAFRRNGKDVFFYKNDTKENYINSTINSNDNIKAGKFLVPDFADYIKMTIEDLKLLKNCFYNMDDKHKYECIIYESYVYNNGFFLTKEQLNRAYKSYKESRKKG